MVSIKDIARAARVSHSTVSRALRNSPLVNPKTGALIRKIAVRERYTVSAVARSLVTRRTNTIGVVVTTIADPFTGEVVSGIEEAALSSGHSVILAACQADPDRELRAVRTFHERRVDGILVMASRLGARYVPLLKEIDVPIVLINGHHPGEFRYSVRIDNFKGAQLAMRHLLDLGHRRIAYLGDRFGFQSDAERREGYRRALLGAGLKYRAALVAHGDGTPASVPLSIAPLLRLPQLPTAIFCYNDRLALGALRAVRERGLRVPDDISIVGFDDLLLSSYTDPPLTTIQQPKQEMGRLATEMLLDLLAGGKPKSRTQEGVLVVRQSTARPRSG